MGKWMNGRARRVRLSNGLVRLYISICGRPSWDAKTIDATSFPRFQAYRADTIVFASGILIVDVDKGFWRRHAGMDNFAGDKLINTLNRWDNARKYGLEMMYQMELRMAQSGWNAEELKHG